MLKLVLLLPAIALSLSGCATTPQAQDPFDVALGMAALGIMNNQPPSDATMQSFSRAVTPPVVQTTTIVQEAPKQEVAK